MRSSNADPTDNWSDCCSCSTERRETGKVGLAKTRHYNQANLDTGMVGYKGSLHMAARTERYMGLRTSAHSAEER